MTDKSQSLSTIFQDDDPDFTRTLPVRVLANESEISIFPQGYGTFALAVGHGCPVCLELNEGRLRLIVFADIGQEDPTHIIDLEGAREVARQDTGSSDQEERTDAQVRD